MPNKLFILLFLLAIGWASIAYAQEENGSGEVKSLGTIIDNLATEQPAVIDENIIVDAPVVEQQDESDFIDPDFLNDDGNAVYDDYKKVTIRILDKITADTTQYDLEIGNTVSYGSLRIRPMACKKSPPIEEPESVSFLQIWEKHINAEDRWVYSGWMFASSPSLAAMEHPTYDVWVIDCKD